MKNIAIILGGGSGSRFGGDMPKQFLPLNGKSVIEHSIDTFSSLSVIDEIAVVIHPDYIKNMKAIAEQRQWTKLTKIIAGGNERYESTYNAIKAYSGLIDETQTNFILHDAARPWVSTDIITRVVSALEQHEAVAVGIHSTDTIWQCSSDTVPTIQQIPIRQQMWRAQTPQAFRFSLLRKAYTKAVQNPAFQPTDDCGVVYSYCQDSPIYVVEGSESNRKITFPSDLQ